MFGGMKGISPREYATRVNALSSGMGGRSTPSTPGQAKGQMKGQMTTPLCLCELMRNSDAKRR